jgi:hypothetical protein
MSHAPHTFFPRVLLASLALLPLAASAQPVSLVPVADNTIFFDGVPTSALSNGVGDGLFVGRTAARAGVAHRGLTRFDLSSIPAGSTITSVQLTMTVTRVPRDFAFTPIALHRVDAPWGEGTSITFGGGGTGSDPGDASWLHRFFPNQFWATPGGDFAATASAVAIAPLDPGPIVWNSTPALVADVQSWLDNPIANFGWLLKGDEVTEASTRKIASREAFLPEERPTLVVDFLPAPTCDSIDFNGDGLFPDDTDLVEFLTVLAGGDCTTGTCNDIDFNNDGLFPDDSDLLAFLTLLAGGDC